MRIVAAIVGAIVAVMVAFKLVGFTSAVQGQKTIVLALVLMAAMCPLCYWVAGRIGCFFSRKTM